MATGGDLWAIVDEGEERGRGGRGGEGRRRARWGEEGEVGFEEEREGEGQARLSPLRSF